MRQPNTYRAIWRNIAHVAGALRLCNAHIAANWSAHIIERQAQAKRCADFVTEKLTAFYAGVKVILNRRLYKETVNDALIAFWQGEKNTRPAWRILSELTNPKAAW